MQMQSGIGVSRARRCRTLWWLGASLVASARGVEGKSSLASAMDEPDETSRSSGDERDDQVSDTSGDVDRVDRS